MFRSKTRTFTFFAVLILGAVLLTVFAPAAQAQEEIPAVTDDDVNRIAKQMFCPVCENVPLDVCPTQACHQWRETIRQLLSEGKSEAEIKTYFVEQYGDRVLAEPPQRGFNLLVYIVPIALLIGGAVYFFLITKRWQKATAEKAEAISSVEADDDYVRKLEEELKRRG